MAKAAHQGLRLTLGGAPDTPHFLLGVPGLFRPGRATPVGGEGEISLEEAKRLHDAEGTPLELVDMTAKEVDEARAQIVEELTAARQGFASAAREGMGSGDAIVGDQREALTTKPAEKASGDTEKEA